MNIAVSAELDKNKHYNNNDKIQIYYYDGSNQQKKVFTNKPKNQFNGTQFILQPI